MCMASQEKAKLNNNLYIKNPIENDSGIDKYIPSDTMDALSQIHPFHMYDTNL